MDEQIKGAIDSFDFKIKEAYEDFRLLYPKETIDFIREISGLNLDLYDFWERYECSAYFSNNNDLNLKIIKSLQDILLESFFLWNCEIFNPKQSYGKVYDEFCRLNNDQSLILKTRICWERIMNFSYILITGKELSSKTSKKNKFKKWAADNEYVFFEDMLLLIEQFDNAFRTPEVHKFSKIRSSITSGEEFDASLYAMTIMLKFTSNIYPNILLILRGENNFSRAWSRVDGELTAFSEIPEWIKNMK